MPNTVYTQVYAPNGRWIGFFISREGAESWVNGREGYEITDRRPTPEERAARL
jgi:hypothetical protein